MESPRGAGSIIRGSSPMQSSNYTTNTPRSSGVQSRMLPSSTPQTDHIRSAIAEQQRELADIAEFRMRSLEEQFRLKTEDAKRANEKYLKLKEDFQYNLKIIEDRDEELNNFESGVAKLKQLLQEKESTIKSLRSKSEEATATLGRADITHRHQVTTLRDSMEQSRKELDSQIETLREQLSSQRRELEREIRDKDHLIASQRESLTNAHEAAVRAREQERTMREAQLLQSIKQLEERAGAAERELGEEQARAVRLDEQEHTLQRRILEYEKTLERLRREHSEEVEGKTLQEEALQRQVKRLEASAQEMMQAFQAKTLESMTELEVMRNRVDADNAEMESRLQASQAEGARRLAEAVSEGEAALAAAQQRAAAEKQELTAQLEAQVGEYRELQATVEGKEGMVAELRNQLWQQDVEKQSDVKEFKAVRAALQQMLDAAHSETEQEKELVRAVQGQRNDLSAELEQMRARAEAAEKQTATVQGLLQSTQAQLQIQQELQFSGLLGNDRALSSGSFVNSQAPQQGGGAAGPQKAPEGDGSVYTERNAAVRENRELHAKLQSQQSQLRQMTSMKESLEQQLSLLRSSPVFSSGNTGGGGGGVAGQSAAATGGRLEGWEREVLESEVAQLRRYLATLQQQQSQQQQQLKEVQALHQQQLSAGAHAAPGLGSSLVEAAEAAAASLQQEVTVLREQAEVLGRHLQQMRAQLRAAQGRTAEVERQLDGLKRAEAAGAAAARSAEQQQQWQQQMLQVQQQAQAQAQVQAQVQLQAQQLNAAGGGGMLPQSPGSPSRVPAAMEPQGVTAADGLSMKLDKAMRTINQLQQEREKLSTLGSQLEAGMRLTMSSASSSHSPSRGKGSPIAKLVEEREAAAAAKLQSKLSSTAESFKSLAANNRELRQQLQQLTQSVLQSSSSRRQVSDSLLSSKAEQFYDSGEVSASSSVLRQSDTGDTRESGHRRRRVRSERVTRSLSRTGHGRAGASRPKGEKVTSSRSRHASNGKSKKKSKSKSASRRKDYSETASSSSSGAAGSNVDASSSSSDADSRRNRRGGSRNGAGRQSREDYAVDSSSDASSALRVQLGVSRDSSLYMERPAMSNDSRQLASFHLQRLKQKRKDMILRQHREFAQGSSDDEEE